ncbi:helix-turn-helix domain-containing protein [Streptomyces sp. NBC_01481]|uniref:helix-turn-helix domain-containing protein n=1 Tax=Streptomyces sp. NBC_01481 TaxID=2975869 RepID=UPI002257F88D|nr:helix-turn-helix domain-containing protein [Streptomyces sp. NBC_01481]MCX4587471.1 helix-turn-helix domain-containing protein [Streptomyces sp. NBC_01481]
MAQLVVALVPGTDEANLLAFAITAGLANPTAQKHLNVEQRLALQRLKNDLSGQGQKSRPNPDPGGEWISTQEAADILYCTTRTVTRKAGRLGGTQRNGKGPWWFEKEAVLRYLREEEE